MSRVAALAALCCLAGCRDKREVTVNHNSDPTEPAAPRTVRGNGLELQVVVGGGVIEATLVNVGELPKKIVSQVDGPDRTHYDAFSVQLAGAGGARELRFTGDRNTSQSPLVTLAPGQSAQHRLDLRAWSTAPINPGGPLAAGNYHATVIYRTTPGGDWWVGELRIAGLDVVIP